MRKLLFSLILTSIVGISSAQEVKTMSFADALDMMIHHNPVLQSKALDKADAEAQLKQSRLYDNPTVGGMYNIYNPMNHRWFDPGHDGEIDISIDQPIAIGGQHSEQVRKAKALTEAAAHDCDDALRELTAQLFSKMAELYFIQQKIKIYDVEQASLEKIELAYKEQTTKGNVPKIEYQRIQTMMFQLAAERQGLQLSANDLQHDIRLLTRSDDDIAPELDVDRLMAQTGKTLNVADLIAMAQSRPDIKMLGSQASAAEHEIKLQKANALPQLTLKGEYDKNGNIGHNYFQAGVELTVPLWNRNQGNIRSAKIQADQSKLQMAAMRREVAEDVRKAVAQLEADRRLAETASKKLESPLADMIANASVQYMKRNISLLQFVDMYDSYKETALSIIDAKANLVQTSIELNKMVGESVIELGVRR